MNPNKQTKKFEVVGYCRGCESKEEYVTNGLCPACRIKALEKELLAFRAALKEMIEKNSELKEMLKRYLEGEETEEDDGFVAVLK